MYQLNFDVPIHVHFIGIGGISMSGLAQILLTRGFTISGSDTHETPITRGSYPLSPAGREHHPGY